MAVCTDVRALGRLRYHQAGVFSTGHITTGAQDARHLETLVCFYLIKLLSAFMAPTSRGYMYFILFYFIYV